MNRPPAETMGNFECPNGPPILPEGGFDVLFVQVSKHRLSDNA